MILAALDTREYKRKGRGLKGLKQAPRTCADVKLSFRIEKLKIEGMMNMYDYDDFYHEPSEFEQQVDEFKQALLNSVKEEYKAEMERLRKENKELQPVKERMKEIERERLREKRDLEEIKKNALGEAKKMRLTELLKDYQHAIYAIDDERIYPPKCDKCDNGRQVEYTTPLGRTAREECTCNKYKTIYRLREVKASVIYHRNPEENIHTEFYDVEREERIAPYFMYKQGTPYTSVSCWTYFADKEEAQKYCDWKNSQED